MDVVQRLGSHVIEPRRGARLTLLVIRTCAAARAAFAADVIRLGHRGPVVSLEAAEEELAQRPKPLGCYAEVRAGVLALTFPSLPAAFLARPESLTGEWYREQYGVDYRRLSILCLGRDDWTILTVGEFESWEATYPFLGEIGFSLTELREAQRVPADALEAARRLEVVRIHDFRGPESGEAVSGHDLIAIARIEPSVRARLCERCGERPARFVLRWYFGRNVPRLLCQRCIDEELSVSEFDEGRQLDRDETALAIAQQNASADELARLAEDYAMHWALRLKPPFLQDFIDRYRR